MAAIKLATLFMKTLTKPIANSLTGSAMATEKNTLKQFCEYMGQMHHTYMTKIQLRNMGHHVKTIIPMEQTAAVKLGAELMADGIVLTFGLGALGLETLRKNVKEEEERFKKEQEKQGERIALEKRILAIEKDILDQEAEATNKLANEIAAIKGEMGSVHGRLGSIQGESGLQRAYLSLHVIILEKKLREVANALRKADVELQNMKETKFHDVETGAQDSNLLMANIIRRHLRTAEEHKRDSV